MTFTSASTVTNFASVFKKSELPGLLKGCKVACIGPITAEAAKKLGLSVDIMPKDYTIPALTRAMAEHFKNIREGAKS